MWQEKCVHYLEIYRRQCGSLEFRGKVTMSTETGRSPSLSSFERCPTVKEWCSCETLLRLWGLSKKDCAGKGFSLH